MLDWKFITREINKDDLLLDCRSQAGYTEKTIKGAYYFPFIKKAYGSDIESQKKICGNLQAVVKLAESEKKNRIVVFDEGMGMFATRMVYLVRGFGFNEIYLLAAKWPFEGQTEAGSRVIEAPPLDKHKPLLGVVDKAFMEKNLTRLQVFDVRTKEEYEGKIPRLTSPEPGTLCGRLPGSFNWDWTSLYNQDGLIIDKATFNKKLSSFPFMPERATVIYDFNGARSALLGFMLKEIGYQEVFTYQGSWFEWRKTNLPKQATSVYQGTEVREELPRLGGFGN